MQIYLAILAFACKYILMKLKGLNDLFKALGDSNRLAIFSHICKCSRRGVKAANVSEVSSCCDVDLSVVSRHLNTLKKAGILSSEKIGKEVHYKVEGQELARKLRQLADYVEVSCCPPSKQGDSNECRRKK